MNGNDRSSTDPWRFPAGTLGSAGSRGDNAQGESTAGTPSSPPAISLPKGGGAFRGIRETFSTNPVTGIGSLSFPLYTSPERSGFGPQLMLSYDSDAGNGLFGRGRSLSLPTIVRKTDKGLSRYRDAVESHVFILSWAEDLVPVLVGSGGQGGRGLRDREFGSTVLWSSASSAFPHRDGRRVKGTWVWKSRLPWLRR